MNKEAEAFLWYAYFGFCKEELYNMPLTDALTVCAERAYRDMNRTLRFADGTNHDDFRDAVCETVVEFAQKLIACETRQTYDETFQKACESIQKTAQTGCALSRDLTYGQAQKWLNMTMKYAWLMERVNGTWLHIPIDNVIMEKLSQTFGVQFPREKNGALRPYSKYSKLAWSNWSKEDYEKVLEDIRNKVKEQCPIQWENDAWTR